MRMAQVNAVVEGSGAWATLVFNPAMSRKCPWGPLVIGRPSFTKHEPIDPAHTA